MINGNMEAVENDTPIDIVFGSYEDGIESKNDPDNKAWQEIIDMVKFVPIESKEV